MKNIILLLTVLLITSCGTTMGKRIDNTKISEIKKGITTKTEITNLLGQPENITNRSDGTTYFIYSFGSVKHSALTYVPVVGLFAHKTAVETENLMITFDDNNIVKNYNYSKGKR